MKRIPPAVVVLLLLTMPAAAQDFEKGLQAYQRGDFAAALKEWRPLAEQGDANVRFNPKGMSRILLKAGASPVIFKATDDEVRQ